MAYDANYPADSLIISLGPAAIRQKGESLKELVDGKAPLTGEGTSGTWPISVSGNAATATGVTAILAQTLTYNTAGQLITAVIGSATFTMTYDSLGRLATVSDGTATMTCTYNAYGQFTGTTI